MTLSSGARLGGYQVVALLGAGGMGEVYRARDTRLGRDVAIKVLPDSFAQDKDRLARFEREAHLLAALNHPHIAAIYGLEQEDGRRWLVLELVPGETLAERLARGGALGIEEALRLALQIAEALEAAHEKGIVHRDLKPGNINVTPDGSVKVLDFGLAKATSGEAEADASRSPTLSVAATRAGVILGTAPYMSPEQARGSAVDKRADVWAFGVVLYEMLTAKRAFGGETVSDTLAAVLKTDPDWGLLPSQTPLRVRELLRRCLEKSLKRRLHDVADARLEIEEALAHPERTSPGPAPLPWRATLRSPAAWVLAALAGAAAAAGVWTLRPPDEPGATALRRFALALPEGDVFRSGGSTFGRAVAFSPDGSRLAYVAVRGTTSQIFLRSLDLLEPMPLPGTEGAVGPFFSPDGQWLVFVAGNGLKKIAVTGGAAVRFLDIPEPPYYGGSWSSTEAIVFTRGHEGLWLLAAPGGAARRLTARDIAKGESSHGWPDVLPGGQAALFTVELAGRPFDEARIELVALETGARRTLIEGGTGARYVPTGHIVFGRGGALLAVPFDLSRLEIAGTPAAVVENLLIHGGMGAAHYAFSGDGSLAYLSGSLALGRPLLRAARNGPAKTLLQPRAYDEVRVSPDGQRVAMSIRSADDDIWIFDVARETLTRLTSGAENSAPIWTRDGERITFKSSRAGPMNLFWQPADGSGAAERLTQSDHDQFPESWSPDGRALVFSDADPETKWDLWLLSLQDRKPQPLLRTPFNEHQADLSPDGRWIAYTSDQSGRDEVYVQPFPGPGGRVQVSTSGGAQPRWARDGREIFYIQAKQLVAAPVRAGVRFEAGKAAVMLDGVEGNDDLRPSYDVAPDGQAFVLATRDPEQLAKPPQLHVVLNWFADLKRRVPTGHRRARP